MQIERVSVGHLAELGRQGDINFRFSNRSTPVDGIRGHQRVQKSRGNLYLPELAIEQEISVADGESVEMVLVAGRIDGVGYLPEEDLFYVEEIKTLRVDVADIPDAVMDIYWRQAKLYAYLLALAHDLPRLAVQLCFYHLDEKTEHLRREVFSRSELLQTLNDAVLLYSALRVEDQRRVKVRMDAMAELSFPYNEYRIGQRDMAVSVFRAVQDKTQLVLQAPTGVGKTMATIYPALNALNPDIGRRVFYLSARTSTQAMALAAAKDISSVGGRIKTVVITSKEKICFNPGQPCHPDHCEYARDYYTGLHSKVADIVAAHDHIDRSVIEAAARERGLCPFELGLDLSRAADLIIADYNYVFDPVVYLRRYFEQDKRDSVVLVDEVHNLVDRGRDMFSAEILKDEILHLAKLLKSTRPLIAKRLNAVNRAVLDLKNRDKDGFETRGHVALNESPQKILTALEAFCLVAEEELRQELPLANRDTLLQQYFDALRFIRTAESFGEEYTTLIFKRGRAICVKLYCVDPSAKLAEVFKRLSSVVAFSATLTPSKYFKSLLGTEESARWYKLPSPFPSAHLSVTIASHIDTSFRGRDASLTALVDLINVVISNRFGNYLVFFPSYSYLTKAYNWLTTYYPEIDVVAQSRAMDDAARADFLENFEGQGVCGFAVMGGVFSEGIDLKGDKLIGVIVVGVGLPQVGIERDLIKDHFPEDGFAFAYQYPGLVKVLQTAGRVIRDAADKGVVCLVDPRYTEPRYRQQLPNHWQPEVADTTALLADRLTAFWEYAEEH